MFGVWRRFQQVLHNTYFPSNWLIFNIKVYVSLCYITRRWHSSIYISENLSYIRRYDIECTNIESIWIQLNKSNKQQFLINIVYRPPSSTQAWIDLYETQLESVDRLSLEFYVLGDINIQYTSNDHTQYGNSKWNDVVTKFGLY